MRKHRHHWVYESQTQRHCSKCHVKQRLLFDGLGFEWTTMTGDETFKPIPIIRMKVTRPDDKSFTCFFPTQKDLENFKDYIETVIENAKATGAEKKRQVG